MVELNEEPTTPRRVLQYIVYPCLVAGGCTFAFVLIWWMTQAPQRPEDLLAAVRSAQGRDRWQAAHEFARRVAADPDLRSDRMIGRQALSIFTSLQDSEPEVAGYLAGVLAILAPEGSAAALEKALDTKNDQLRIRLALALAGMGGKASASALVALLGDEDSGVRKAAAFAVGRLGGDGDVPLLEPLLRDREVDVRWNAALGLANLGSDAGMDVLREMLDRSHLREVSTRRAEEGSPGMTGDEISKVILNAIRAAALVHRPELRKDLEELQDGDEDPRIQQAARLALGEFPAVSAPKRGGQ